MNLTCPATEIAQVSASQACLHEAERSVIGMEIQKLYNKGVISKCTSQAHQFVSPVFVRPEKDGTHRMILNLKRLNEDITYLHFKMDTLQKALTLVFPNCYMASIDLKDTYYSVSITGKLTENF